MCKLRHLVLSIFFLGNLSLAALIQLDGVEFNLHPWIWEMQDYSCGFFYHDVGYYHLQKHDHKLNIYVSNRYIDAEDPNGFLRALFPLEKNLCPYATPHWEEGAVLKEISRKDVYVDVYAAKKLIFEVDYPSRDSETLVTYLIPKECFSFFIDRILGYTVSFSCPKKEFNHREKEINAIVKDLSLN